MIKYLECMLPIVFGLFIICLFASIAYVALTNVPQSVKVHCIDGYLFYYSEKDRLYISRTAPPKACIKESEL